MPGEINTERLSDERLGEIRDSLDNGMAARMMAAELLTYRRAATSDGDVANVAERLRQRAARNIEDAGPSAKEDLRQAADLIVSLQSRLAAAERNLRDALAVAEPWHRAVETARTELDAADAKLAEATRRAEAAETALATIRLETIEAYAQVKEAHGTDFDPEVGEWLIAAIEAVKRSKNG